MRSFLTIVNRASRNGDHLVTEDGKLLTQFFDGLPEYHSETHIEENAFFKTSMC